MRVRAFVCNWWLALLLASTPLIAQPPTAPPPADRTEANIAGVTAVLLEKEHYLHHPFDQEIANRFVDRYLDALDHFHLYFLQSDLDEFAPYRTNLNVMVMHGDNSACRVIFKRFMERAEQRLNYVTNLIATREFEFTGNDRFIPDRHLLPVPKDLAEAKKLWEQELRFEYLQEKLQAPDMKFTGSASLNGATQIHLTKDKAHPLSFSFLPKTFYDDSKRSFGSVIIEKETNAVVRLQNSPQENQKKTESKVYSDSGLEVGKVTIKWQTNDVSSATNTVAGATNGVADGTNRLVGIIQLNQKNMADVVKTLTNRYNRLVKNYKELDNDDVFEIYLTSLARAYDPHSDYMGHAQAENFAIMMKLSLFGIGAVLQADDGYCKVAELTEAGPAAKSGKIRPGDRIVAVAQGDKEPVDVVGMKLTRVVEQIRGPKGTQVRLTIIPTSAADSSARQVVTLIRDEINLVDQAAKAKVYDVPSANGKTVRLGVIDLPSFYGDMTGRTGPDRKSTTTDVAKLLERLKKERVDGVVLDLRRNGGGFLEEAISLTGLFITKGPVVQTKESNGDISVDSDPDPSILYSGPLIVLTSRFSASASEILAGALQDYGRAMIVGDRSTYGKGTVQSMLPLAGFLDRRNLAHSYDPGNLKMTIKKFYRAGGASTQREGVKPDIELPSVLSYAEVGESFMENNLPWDDVTSADLQNLNMVKPFLTDLKNRSSKRLETDKDFAYVREDIEQFQKTLADKSVSLNESERLAEKKTNEARQEARKKERQSRSKPDEKVYEITLKNINIPELQPPTVKTNEVAAAHAALLELDDELTPADPKAPDPMLEETKRILADYITLWAKAPVIANTTKSLSE